MRIVTTRKKYGKIVPKICTIFKYNWRPGSAGFKLNTVFILSLRQDYEIFFIQVFIFAFNFVLGCTSYNIFPSVYTQNIGIFFYRL